MSDTALLLIQWGIAFGVGFTLGRKMVECIEDLAYLMLEAIFAPKGADKNG